LQGTPPQCETIKLPFDAGISSFERHYGCPQPILNNIRFLF